MIHGLWPQINSTTYPENCETVLYIPPRGKLLENMNTYWHKCDDTLWEHEWEKHGSCVKEQNNMDEYTFFNITIMLFLENKELIINCKEDDCILGCFDLDYKLIPCK
jgi:ribonuclease I